jgi:hypothetical protein
MARIQTEWNAVLEETMPQGRRQRQPTELSEFLSTSKSNGKELQWAVLECQAACQFRLHAHPNLELIYCVAGSLFEIRRQQQQPDGDVWSFGTLQAGQWLVNETDSIHKSFTATNSTGCTLLVLWSGSHANLNEIPFVQDAVTSLDAKLHSNNYQDCCGANWAEIKETFLPDSEKQAVSAKELDPHSTIQTDHGLIQQQE